MCMSVAVSIHKANISTYIVAGYIPTIISMQEQKKTIKEIDADITYKNKKERKYRHDKRGNTDMQNER